jgi:phage baseplate assembly protein gpV
VIEAADGSAKITVGGKSVEVTPSKILINGDVEVTGKINTTGDVIAGSISLQTHKHGGVQSGGSQTSTPV